MPEFQVVKAAPERARIVETPSGGPLWPGQVLARIDRFAFTANNITYAVVGEQIGYWKFFPPAGEEIEGWGVIPVWGFADVVASEAEELPVGERLYGYFPPASHVVLTPTKVSPKRFVDGSAHRAELPAGYNTYERVQGESAALDHERALLFPLHLTSFCLWDALKDEDWYGARQVVIISASSKTSIGLAYALEDDPDAPRVIGLTSARNLAFVAELGPYDEATTYDELGRVDASVPTVIVDMAGDRKVAAALHTRLGENMRYHVGVGLTHWEEVETDPGEDGFIAARAAFFFAPAHVQKRMKDWGPEGFAQRSHAAMQAAAAKSRTWLEVRSVDGLTGLAELYPEIVAGRLRPQEGVMVTLG